MIEQYEVEELLQEVKQLRQDNEDLLNVITQMKVTLNRLLERYIIKQSD